MATRAELTLAGRLDTYVALLHGGAGLFAASQDVSAEEFNRYVQELDLAERYPGVQGIGFSEALPLDAPPRSRIRFIEPMNRRNQAAMGFDMYGEPTRRAAMARARDEGVAAVTDRVTLRQEIEERKQPGFLIYVPIYQGGGAPGTVEERRRRLVGWSYAAFRVEDFLQATFASTDLLDRLALAVTDGSGARLLAAPRAGAGRFEERRLEALGRVWRLRATPGRSFEGPRPCARRLPWPWAAYSPPFCSRSRPGLSTGRCGAPRRRKRGRAPPNSRPSCCCARSTTGSPTACSW
ncbi:MAG: CHASE domain-containing protein [Proteobacteria bacterium]|nr:CHASE domain-containing protein [Pseudomonadota bacterium]